VLSTSSPDKKGYQITKVLTDILAWRINLSLFFENFTGLTPRPFQKDFFDEVQTLKSKNLVIVAGRGIGKTLSLAIVALWYTVVLSVTENRPMKVTILGGSLEQAKICFNYIMECINSNPYLQRQLAKEPTQREIIFKDGSWIRPLAASEKSVRGHHPDLLIIDEAAQVEDKIIYAALPMTAPSPYSRQIFSTTPSEGFSWIEEKWEHQARYPYPEWKFFNWNAESFLDPSQIELLKNSLPEDRYRSEIQGLPYKREGKVFRISDLKLCEKKGIKFNPSLETYAGLDWGYYPCPTVLVIVQKENDNWNILYSKDWLREHHATVLDEIEKTCLSYNVRCIFTDSTNKGENIRLSSRGLPVRPISFKAEKSVMLANLRSLVESHRLKFDPYTQQILIGQLLDYTYKTKRNDDYVDALMLALKTNPIFKSSTNLTEFLKEGFVKKKKNLIREDEERKRLVRERLKGIR